MRALLIGEEQREQIQKVIKFAEANVFNLEKMKELQEKKAAAVPVGDQNKGFRCELPVGFRVVYSIEEQPVGMCRHISISVDRPGRMAHPAAISEIMKEFGFSADGSRESTTWTEPIENGTSVAINIIERMQ